MPHQLTAGPIFLAGADRSGIGLLREVLNTHPAIHLSRRTRFWSLYADRSRPLGGPTDVRRVVDAMSEHPRMAELGLQAERIMSELSVHDGPVSYGELFETIHRHHLEQIGKSRWGDKSLDAEIHAEQIFQEFPDAVMLHVIRDPRDRYASHASHRGIPRGRVGAGTALWLRSASLAERNRSLFQGRYHVVRYEDLVIEPRTTIERVCELVGEPFDPAMLTSFAMPPTHRDMISPMSEHVFSPISIGRYQSELSPRDIAYIDRAAAPAMSTFGYRASSIRLNRAQRLRLALVDLPMNSLWLSSWRFNDRVRAELHRRRSHRYS